MPKSATLRGDGVQGPQLARGKKSPKIFGSSTNATQRTVTKDTQNTTKRLARKTPAERMMKKLRWSKEGRLNPRRPKRKSTRLRTQCGPGGAAGTSLGVIKTPMRHRRYFLQKQREKGNLSGRGQGGLHMAKIAQVRREESMWRRKKGKTAVRKKICLTESKKSFK